MNGFKPWYWVIAGTVALLTVIGQWGNGGKVWADSRNFQGGTIPTKTPIGGVGQVTPVAPATTLVVEASPLLPTTPVVIPQGTGDGSTADREGLFSRLGVWWFIFVAGVVVFIGGVWFSWRRVK